MILVVDTSAFLAVYLDESHAKWTADALSLPVRKVMSTVNLTEAYIAAKRATLTGVVEVSQLLATSRIELVAPDEQQAVVAADARSRFSINFGDCFVYALARAVGGIILTLDADFRRVDVPVLMP